MGVQRRRQDQSGMSLLELLLAVSVFSTGFLMILGAFPTAAAAVGQSEALAAATFLTERHLESLRSREFGAIASLTSEVTVAAGTERVRMTTQVVVTSPRSNLKRIRAVTQWDGGATGPKVVEMETLVARQG